MILTDGAKKELALAIFLWRSFKSQGKMDLQIFKQTLELVKHIGVEAEFDKLDHEIIFPIEVKIKD